MDRLRFEEVHSQFRESVRSWISKEVVPYAEQWNADGIVPRRFFERAGELGFLAMAAPEEFGGGGTDDFRFNQVIDEEIQSAGVSGCGLGLTLHNDICLPYFLKYCSAEQMRRWLPGI